ncbi:MAG: FAD-binding oxidoreductase [Pegethrix bostrychoides GSE-TBD4-15B]|jgi:lycopene cyclase CruP|uniref:FAD-binding oxidoreductase n=1 Tax=Pegethrix bostrychoides GSE-TBD4-15B TaxID=2839662 RepID=A0A951PH08_9CYAN|nr:FAD-binding oxidoreductase [Pegethrix bostrychoides GSE-TBD4-15B]
MSLTAQILSQLPGTLETLRRADLLWQSYRDSSLPVVTVIQESPELLTQPDWDVIICGGTLGILIGAALAERGWRVALLERGRLRGRDQEWNISRQELQVLVELGLLSDAQLEQAIVTEYNPARLSFHKGIELCVENVLNVGVDPVFLLEALKEKFLAAGGHLVEQAAFETATLHSNGVSIQTNSGSFRARLLLDAMGHFSPIVRQARQGQRPDAVCLVVGSCAQGYAANQTGDLFASFTPIQDQRQYFWEAFPARDGRTTYLFTYLDADPSHPSLEALFEEYLHLLPDYQGVSLDQLQFQRALFGFFPCYRQPLKLSWNRMLAVGDSSGNQSPLSFGGFGAMIRHLRRLTNGTEAALQADLLDAQNLSLLQPYQPSLAVTWLFQRAMSVGVNQNLAPNQINELLSGVFGQMDELGDAVLKPFLQDVVQFPALTQTMLRVAITHPGLVLRVLPQVGVVTLLEWLGHYLLLATYTGLYRAGRRIQPWMQSLSASDHYRFERWLEAWQYGSGQDYHG